jgi:ribonuclease P protein component
LQISEETNAGVSLLISVSKKRIKLAVKRNRIKRLIRETYRLNKHALHNAIDAANKRLVFAILYQENEICPYTVFENNMKTTIAELIKSIK